MKVCRSYTTLLTIVVLPIVSITTPTLVCALQAQEPTTASPPLAPLAARFDHETAAIITRIVDSAQAQQLPTQPLIARALEGASRRVPDARIINVVRAYAHALSVSRDALGGHAPNDELLAGADVILAGVKPTSLTTLRTIRDTQPLTVPLVVLADLVARGVPTIDATDAVLAVARAKAPDAKFLDLQRSVANDITLGASPAGALALRVQGITHEAPPPTAPSHPTVHAPLHEASEPIPARFEYGTLFSFDARAWTSHNSAFTYPLRPSFSAGTWIRHGHLTGSFSIEEGLNVTNHSLPSGDTLPITRPQGSGSNTPEQLQSPVPLSHSITDVTAALQWNTNRLELQAFSGARFGNALPARARIGTNAAFAISNLLALTARVERLPQREVSFSRGTNMAFGLRVLEVPHFWHHQTAAQPLVTEFQVQTSQTTGQTSDTTANTTTAIRLHAPHATSIELEGDFTNWEPVPLTAAGDGWWEYHSSITPGVHHLNIRVDHTDWTPPPDVPTVRDAYDGLVGVVII